VERLEGLEVLDSLDRLGLVDHRGQTDSLVLMGLRGHRVLRDQLGTQGLVDRLERQVPRAYLDLLVDQDLLEHQEVLEQVVRVDFLALQDHQGLQVQLGPQEILVRLGQQEVQGPQDHPEAPVSLG